MDEAKQEVKNVRGFNESIGGRKPIHKENEGGDTIQNTPQTIEKESGSECYPQLIGRCSVCSKDGCVKKCARCKNIFYCSKPCQKVDWPFHKKFCKINEETKSFKDTAAKSSEHIVQKETVIDNYQDADCLEEVRQGSELECKTRSVQTIIRLENPQASEFNSVEELNRNSEVVGKTNCQFSTESGGGVKGVDTHGEDSKVNAAQKENGDCNRCSAGGCDKKCARCKMVFYCSKTCQAEDWTRHKTSCKKTSSNSERKQETTEDNFIFSDDEKRVIAERQSRHQSRQEHNMWLVESERKGMTLGNVCDFSGSPLRIHAVLTPEQLRVFKRAPRDSLQLAVQYAKQCLPEMNVIETFDYVPPEHMLLGGLFGYGVPPMNNVLVAFMFMYHDHIMRHGVYLKDASDNITHVEFYFDDFGDSPYPFFTYDQVRPGNYILLKRPVMHLFRDGQVGLRMNKPSEVMIYTVGSN